MGVWCLLYSPHSQACSEKGRPGNEPSCCVDSLEPVRMVRVLIAQDVLRLGGAYHMVVYLLGGKEVGDSILLYTCSGWVFILY